MIDSLLKFDKIMANEHSFFNQIFDLKNERLKIFSFKSDYIIFENCTFNSETLEIKNINNPKLVLIFRDCTFNCSVEFSNCTFDQLTINNTKQIKSLSIKGKQITDNYFELNTFQFANVNNDLPTLSTDFHFSNIKFHKIFSFENITQVEGNFRFTENILGNYETNNGQFIFFNSTFVNPIFSHNSFNEETSFYLAEFKNSLKIKNEDSLNYKKNLFKKNTFYKVDFIKSNFNSETLFTNCDFKSTAWFEECKNLENSNLRFLACEFEGFVLYNHSTLNLLEIDRCTFDKSVSFSDAIFNKIILFEVKFGGGAYFDEMKINNVINKSYLKNDAKEILGWKRTLRAIKQELQKTENRIDFNRFRSYELAAHYKELRWKSNFSDKFILLLTKVSTDFGRSWAKAFLFTILSGFFWYCILYRIENSGTFNLEKTNEFFVGLFRFFLVTDFYNPLLIDVPREYLKDGWSWFVFIFGKIFIAFGIYEMIQSFRKFKA